MIIVLLSGPIASGKSTLATKLRDDLGFKIFSSRRYLEERFSTTDRLELQKAGAALTQSEPNWVAEAMALENRQRIVVDCIREPEQANMIRAHFMSAQIVHAHLEAEGNELFARYEDRGDTEDYAKAKAEVVELNVPTMRAAADVVINTGSCSKADTFTRVFARINLFSSTRQKSVDVLVGGQFGSEGKGHVVAHIAPEYGALVRVGGPNAGHSVLYKGGHYSFYHLPSGVLHSPTAWLFLGAGININLAVLKKEIDLAESLGVDVRSRLIIDPQANVITPNDINTELGLVKGMGSTGQGVGAATARRIMGRSEPSRLVGDNMDIVQEAIGPFLSHKVIEELELLYGKTRILLEGTQGTGLSLFHGDYPYVTSRDTTCQGTMADAGISPRHINRIIMVVRTNPIRVQSPVDGTSGPMGKEIDWETVSKRCGVPADILREREKTTTTKRQRRVSEFDWTLLRRSCMLNAPTDIALTFTDYMDEANTRARRFEQLTEGTRNFINEIEMVAKAPVSMITTRLHTRSIIDRRAW